MRVVRWEGVVPFCPMSSFKSSACVSTDGEGRRSLVSPSSFKSSVCVSTDGGGWRSLMSPSSTLLGREGGVPFCSLPSLSIRLGGEGVVPFSPPPCVCVSGAPVNKPAAADSWLLFVLVDDRIDCVDDAGDGGNSGAEVCSPFGGPTLVGGWLITCKARK